MKKMGIPGQIFDPELHSVKDARGMMSEISQSRLAIQAKMEKNDGVL